MCTHVHGAVGVNDDSDGYAEAWYLPNAKNIPSGYARKGTWFDFFKGKAALNYGVTWGTGYATFQYPNENRASTVWYHDHTLGMTRTNVYAGPAGFYLIRGGFSDTVLDSRSGKPAVLPGPAPKAGDAFPPTKPYYEIPVAIQDRAFNSDGSLFYPGTREFFDGATATNPGFIPKTDLSPIWNPEFFGNTMMVNGSTWPYLAVEKRRYRFRFLNGCQSRFLILDFSAIPGVKVWQIGNEGGFLKSPVNLTSTNANRVLMALAERADVVVDFTNVPIGNYVLKNVGPDEPFGGGQPGVDFVPSDPASTGRVMQFRVRAAVSTDTSTPPQYLKMPTICPFPPEVKRRRVVLAEVESSFWPGPAEAMLGVVQSDPSLQPAKYVQKMWMEPVTENPNVGATEVWEIYNTTVDAHPMHIHEVMFEVANRQKITVDTVASTVQLVPGTLRAPESWERGLKDTVISYPGEVVRLRMTFKKPGQFVWHCHIVEHEDNEMMRPYRIGPVQPGQPM
jgi:FtsP/CotA-like multicopper oxidase with cupredoxin domain